MTVTLDLKCGAIPPLPSSAFHRGQWVNSASGETFNTPNPATGEPLARSPGAPKTSTGPCGRRAGFRRWPLGRMTPSERGQVIWRIGDLIEEHLDEFAQLESLDNGKPLAVARAADVPLAADLFHYMAGWATKIEGNTYQHPVPYMPGAKFHAYTLREPVGVVGQIIPWNFPLLMAAWKLGPGAGHRQLRGAQAGRADAAVGAAAGRADRRGGLPDGVVNVVTGFGETAGAALAAHDDVDKSPSPARPRSAS